MAPLGSGATTVLESPRGADGLDLFGHRTEHMIIAAVAVTVNLKMTRMNGGFRWMLRAMTGK